MTGSVEITVQTVTGKVPVGELGATLTHEHLWSDVTNYLWVPPQPWKSQLVNRPVSAELAWVLREDPFFHPDNCRLDSVPQAVLELANFADAGGKTVIEVTNPGMGRSAERLRDISSESNVQVVMGSGWYIDTTHSQDVRSASVGQLQELLLQEFDQGVDDTGIKPGIIGEIGVSTVPTPSEINCLRAAARAQSELAVPLLVHLDGWARMGHEVLDLLEGEGANLRGVVLGHMNPSGNDLKYQLSLAERGAFLGFDMTGMGFYYEDHGGQSPSPEQDSAHIGALIEHGYLEHLLISHDVFVKAMWTVNGGNGYGYVPRLFLPRLQRDHGLTDSDLQTLIAGNPARLFSAAAG